MNWFMVKASSYWFPSAESKYQDGLDEMRTYLENLKAGKATFYIRADNLIPLLASFEDLLGSCDENLVKDTNEDGTPVSFFKADDYFYYTKGVASAMAMVLEAVHHDFLLTLESRNATELLQPRHRVLSAGRRVVAMDRPGSRPEQHLLQSPRQHGSAHQPRAVLPGAVGQNIVHIIWVGLF